MLKENAADQEKTLAYEGACAEVRRLKGLLTEAEQHSKTLGVGSDQMAALETRVAQLTAENAEL